MRKFRLTEIKKIISSQKIPDQDTLLTELKQKSFNITQATLSRDLKQLKIAKVFDENEGFIYALPNELKRYERRIPSYNGSLNGFISITFSLNIAVISTLPGHANQVALFIDYKECPVTLGTIAGDDTILVILKEENTKEELINCLLDNFPELEGRI